MPEQKRRAWSALSGGGQMGELARSIDWARTPVGPVESWPQSLRTAVSIVLESRFPMLVCWGPEFVQFYNDPFRPILGSSKHPAMGRSTRETFAEAWHLIGPLFEQVMQGTAVGFDDMLVPLDRFGFLEECYFVYSYSPIRDESGGVAGVLVTCTETTARVVAERRLRTLRELASQAAHAQAEAHAWQGAAQVLIRNPVDVPFAELYALDASGRTLTLAAATTDVPTSPPAGSGDRIAPWPPFDPAATTEPLVIEDVQRRVGAVRGSAWPEPVERALVQPVTRPGLAQPYGFVVAGLSPRLAFDGQYRDFLGLVADQIATALANARAYAEERRRMDALLELDRQKTAFFSNVSHEFRTPLTLMLGPLEAAVARSTVALDGAEVELVHSNARRLLRLVNTLLDFSRIEAGRTTLAREPTDVAALTRDLASTFQSLMDQAGLGFEIDCPPLSAAARIDRAMWEKIVLNLLSNAFKFTLAGRVRVSLREQPGAFQLSVDDTGGGIPAADVPHIFDRFHRVPATPSRTFEGSGIGLALVRELVAMHGGEIHVDTAEGRGSTFTITMPLDAVGAPERAGPAAVPMAAALPFIEEARQWSGAVRTPGPLARDVPVADSPGRLLVVDDNADIRDYLARLLGQHWLVDVAANGREALELIPRVRPDLVLTDVMMPELDGLGLLRAIREQPGTRLLPVILLSARSAEESRIEGLASGADDYVAKPFAARELLARVRTHLELSRLRHEAHARTERAREAAEADSHAKDEFLAMLGHELRNPLAPILTALQLMTLRGDRGAERERTIIERQVRYVVRLVDDLLDVSRIARGKIELKRERVEMAAVVAQAVEMASPVIEQKQHELNIDVAPDGLAVEADPTRLQQVVFNLLQNAAKYSEPKGRIRVEAARREDTIELRVRDAGVGISAEMLPHVFDLFFQARQALDRAQGGLGLGLTIVRNLIELHGGRVSAASEGPGRGSEFVVTLPAAPQQRVHRAASPPPAPATGRTGTRVLVVDDNLDAVALLVDALAVAGFEARAARDAVEALRLADTFVPDVAVLDLGLPLVDGYELAGRLRQQRRTPTLVALTGYGGPADRQRTRATGFDLHLVKPIDVTELISFVRQAGSRRAAE